MNSKYVVLTYFSNNNVYCYSFNSDADMFQYTSGALNYNKNKQADASSVTDVQVYAIDIDKKGMHLIHDMEIKN